MKKLILVFIVGLTLCSTVSADKIKYYAATTSLTKQMGENGTASSTFYYAPAVVVSAVVETVLSPSVWFWNLFQNKEVETSTTK